MQRRDSLGSTTKIPKQSKGSTRKFRTRRSQSSVSSVPDVFADNQSTKGQAGLSVSEMKLRSEKNLDGDQGRNAEAGPASETLVDPFDEGERTLIRPDFEPSEDLEWKEVERTEETSERSEVEPREEVLFKGMSKSETKSRRWRGEYSHSASTHSSLARQSNNAMMSSISPSEEQPVSKAKKSWKSLYDERMASLPTVGLTSSYDYPETSHPDVNFTPCPRNDKRSEVEPREEVLFRGMSKSETKSHRWRREFSHPANTHPSFAKQSNNAMMSSISPSEEQQGSKAKKSWKSLYDERIASLRTEGLSSSYDHPEITHPDVNLTPCPRNDMSGKASSVSPTRPMSDGITMGASSTFDRLMTSMSKQKGGASSSTRLRPQLTSSSLELTPPLGATGDISDMFAGVMNGLDELRRGMTKRIDQLDARAHQGRENLRDELTHVKSQARVDQAQLIRNTDQCLAESLAQANKESEEREARMTREIEQLFNDHDNTYAHTMTSLEKRLDAKPDLLMRKLDGILNGSNWEERSNPRERPRHANDRDGAGSYARAQ